ncbi:hypothetical protein MKW94_025391 [Papaver nudicaule]|uniref:Uncharacterized protein n=1 Tax=Papaver nudicaule TaxID=74823 RepID=A0AA41SDM2_PAPNU|nr:hypothetical protein [Papaver nudicaule]
MAVYERSVEVYPHDINQMLEKYSNYPDADSIRMASYDLRYILTEENHKDFEKQLVLMKKLSNKLKHEAQVSGKTINDAIKEQTCLCIELAQKVPGIRDDPMYRKFSTSQAVTIKTYLEQQRRKELGAATNPKAEELKTLLASFSAKELAQILQLPVDMTEKIKKRLPKASKVPQKPAQVVENLTTTMDPQKPAELRIGEYQLKDIPLVLQGIFRKIEEHIERSGFCLRLLRSVGNFIEALALRLDVLRKERKKWAMESVTGINLHL